MAKATFYIAEDVLRAAKVSAARTGRRDSEVVEAALRRYLGFDVLDRAWARSELSEKAAMKLAVSEVHASRHPRSSPSSEPSWNVRSSRPTSRSTRSKLSSS